MAKMKVKAGCVLIYPDGSVRGGAGYVVDTEGGHESRALHGQLGKLEPCADYVSSSDADQAKLTAEFAVPPVTEEAPKKAKKKAKKKAAKK